jgi:hypothetical protein
VWKRRLRVLSGLTMLAAMGAALAIVLIPWPLSIAQSVAAFWGAVVVILPNPWFAILAPRNPARDLDAGCDAAPRVFSACNPWHASNFHSNYTF